MRPYGILLAMLALLPLGLLAQDRLRPSTRQELWTSVAIQGRPSILAGVLGKETVKRLKTSAELGYRSSDSFFAGRQYYLDLGATYKISEKISAGGEFRYAVRTGRTDRQRLGGMIQYKTQWNRLELAYRFTYQHNFRFPGEIREVLRNKLIAGYDLPKWKLDPQFSAEAFTWAGPSGLAYIGIRYKLGTEWNFNKVHALGFAVVHDRERMVFAPEHRMILAVDYSIKLRKAKDGSGT